jgi:hypothetical protein
LSPKRAATAIGVAFFVLAIGACALAGTDVQGPSGLSQHALAKTATAPASIADFISKSAEKAHSADAGVVKEKLNVLQNIAGSVKAQVAKLQAESNTLSASHASASAGKKDAPATSVSTTVSMAAEAQRRWKELHKPATSFVASSAAAGKSSKAVQSASSPVPAASDLIALVAQANSAAADAADAVDAQRLIVAREASSYMKAEKRALIVQEKAAAAEAKADTARALSAEDAAKRAQKQAAVFRKRAVRASAKAAKYAAQVKSYDDDYWNNEKAR